jgi:hypothetical protein
MFRTNNQRLTYLLRHCTSPEYGFTIREFANAIHPDKMSSGEDWERDMAFMAITKMFNRYKKDVLNHEVMLAAIPEKGIYYHYNIIDDEEAQKQQELRAARVVLGLDRSIQELQHMAEHSEELERQRQQRYDEIMLKVKKAKANKTKPKSRHKPTKLDKNQRTLI